MTTEKLNTEETFRREKGRTVLSSRTKQPADALQRRRKSNGAECTAFLQMAFDGDTLLLVAIVPDGGIEAAHFSIPSQLHDAEGWIAKRNGHMGLYYTLNQTGANVVMKPKKGDIAAARGLHADVDPDYNKPLNEELERLDRLADALCSLKELAPSVIVHSGNGIQPIWPLDSFPTRTEADRDLIEQLNRRLEAALGAGGTHNIDRLLRVPGTTNLPNRKKAKAGRVPVQTRVIAINGVRVDPTWYEMPPAALNRFKLSEIGSLVEHIEGRLAETGLVQPKASSAVSRPRRSTRRSDKEIACTNEIKAHWSRVTSCASLAQFEAQEPDLDRRLLEATGRSNTLSGRLDGHLDGLNDQSRSGWDQSIVTLLRRAGFDLLETCQLTYVLGSETGLGRGGELDARQLARSWIVAEGPRAQDVFGALSEEETNEIDAAAGAALDANAPSWVKEWNARFAFVRGYAIVEIDRCGQITATMTSKEFTEFYNKDRVQVGSKAGEKPIFRPKGTAWVENSYRRDYDRIGIFPPSEETPRDYNLWRGLPLSSKNVPWPTIKEYLLDTLCGGDRPAYEWLIHWIARALQCPLEPGETGIVIKGRQGTGKSTFFVLLETIFGKQLCLHATDEVTVFGKFNMILEGKVIVFLDEAAFGFNKGLAPKIKGLLTEPGMHVEDKFIKRRATRNIGHYVIVSNSEAPLPIDPDDRRFLVLTASPRRCRDQAYFDRLRHAIKGDELLGFIHWCQSVDLAHFNHREPPFTDAKASVADATAAPEIEFWMNALESGEMPGLLASGDWETKPVQVPKTHFQSAYQQFMHNRREPVRPKGFLIATVKAQCPDLSENRPWIDKRRGRRSSPLLSFPPLQECRDAFDQRNGKRHWPTLSAASPPPRSMSHPVPARPRRSRARRPAGPITPVPQGGDKSSTNAIEPLVPS